MMRIKDIIISYEAPDLKEVGWVLPLEDGTFDLKFFGPNGWVSSTSGVQGPKGEKGDTGPQGPKGDKGDKGDTGEIGPQGPQGEKGDVGETGATGPKGDKGDTGAQGPAGQDGAQGATGPAGADGKSIKAIALTTNTAGAVTGGTATLSDDSIIQITVTTSEG